MPFLSFWLACRSSRMLVISPPKADGAITTAPAATLKQVRLVMMFPARPILHECRCPDNVDIGAPGIRGRYPRETGHRNEGVQAGIACRMQAEGGLNWTADNYWLTRTVFQRGLALVYLIAFLNAVNQFRPLLG